MNLGGEGGIRTGAVSGPAASEPGDPRRPVDASEAARVWPGPLQGARSEAEGGFPVTDRPDSNPTLGATGNLIRGSPDERSKPGRLQQLRHPQERHRESFSAVRLPASVRLPAENDSRCLPAVGESLLESPSAKHRERFLPLGLRLFRVGSGKTSPGVAWPSRLLPPAGNTSPGVVLTAGGPLPMSGRTTPGVLFVRAISGKRAPAGRKRLPVFAGRG